MDHNRVGVEKAYLRTSPLQASRAPSPYSKRRPAVVAGFGKMRQVLEMYDNVEVLPMSYIEIRLTSRWMVPSSDEAMVSR
jgi:hypothetical protein